MRLGELYTELTVRDNKFKRSIRGVRQTLRKVAGEVMAFANRLKWVFIAAAAGVGYFVKKASDVIEQQSKFKAVFKEEAKAAEDFAKTLGDAIGRSSFKIMDMMSTLQDTFVPLGFARKEARLLSQQMTKLAIDVASFQNKASPEVMRDFQSAIVGNHETVRKYGIIITQARLSQELMNMGVEKGVENATAMQKVQARLNIIMQGTTDAQGDAERTAGQFANKMRALWDSIYDLSVQLGSALIPMVEQVTDCIKDAVPYVRQWLEENKELVKSVGELIATSIVETLKNIGRFLQIMFEVIADNKDAIKSLVDDLRKLVSFAAKFASAGAPLLKFYRSLRGESKKTLDNTKKTLDELSAARDKQLGINRGGAEASGGIRREGFTPPNKNVQFEPTFRTGETQERRGGFVGIAELAKSFQRGIFEQDRIRREKKMLLLSERQLKTLEDLKKLAAQQSPALEIT